jgi:hypothetical protein
VKWEIKWNETPSSNWKLRRMFGPEMNKVTGGGENSMMRISVICTLHQITR